MVGSFFPGDDGFGLRVIVFWREYWGHPFFFFFLFFPSLPFTLCECHFSLFEALTKYLALLGEHIIMGVYENLRDSPVVFFLILLCFTFYFVFTASRGEGFY